jgi:hypothetical protein
MKKNAPILAGYQTQPSWPPWLGILLVRAWAWLGGTWDGQATTARAGRPPGGTMGGGRCACSAACTKPYVHAAQQAQLKSMPEHAGVTRSTPPHATDLLETIHGGARPASVPWTDSSRGPSHGHARGVARSEPACVRMAGAGRCMSVSWSFSRNLRESDMNSWALQGSHVTRYICLKTKV